MQLSALASDPGEPALDAVRRDGDLHVVLIDHHEAADRSAVHLAQAINRLRVEELAGDAVDGYCFRGETDHAGWLRILAAEVAQTAATPFYDALRHYVAQAKDSWHTPGHPDAQVLILTSCTYDGLRYDLAPLVAAAHAAGIKGIVDEAWYGHARFHPELRPSALESGADYVTQSTHKVLSAFSQASMIHVNDPDFDEHLFRENFNMHASTSPQYGLIASLDVARKQAVMEGYQLLDRSLQFAAELREKINTTGAFRVLALEDLLSDEVRGDGIRLDPTKLTIDMSASGWGADELRDELSERFNIQIEKNTHSTRTLLLTIGTTRSKVSRLFDAMLRPDRAVPAGDSGAGAGAGGGCGHPRLSGAPAADAEIDRAERAGDPRWRAAPAGADPGRAGGAAAAGVSGDRPLPGLPHCGCIGSAPRSHIFRLASAESVSVRPETASAVGRVARVRRSLAFRSRIPGWSRPVVSRAPMSNTRSQPL